MNTCFRSLHDQLAANSAMHIYSYVIPHDYGFAPNPYGGFLTGGILTWATCRPEIRRTAASDYIVGTDSASTVGPGTLVHAADISDVVSLQDYPLRDYPTRDYPLRDTGQLAEYRLKRPSASGPHWRPHGDSYYSSGGRCVYLNSASVRRRSVNFVVRS